MFRTLCFLAGSTPLTTTAAFPHAFPSSALLALGYNDDNWRQTRCHNNTIKFCACSQFLSYYFVRIFAQQWSLWSSSQNQPELFWNQVAKQKPVMCIFFPLNLYFCVITDTQVSSILFHFHSFLPQLEVQRKKKAIPEQTSLMALISSLQSLAKRFDAALPGYEYSQNLSSA